MSAGEIIDSSLRLYQRLGLTFLRLSVAPTLLCLASVAFVLAYVLPGLVYSQDQGKFAAHVANVVFAVVLAIFVGGPLFLTGLSYITCSVVSMVSDYMVGNVVAPNAALQVAHRGMPRLLVATLRELLMALSGVLVAAALVLFGEYIASVTPENSATAGVIVLLGVLGLGGGGLVCLAVLAQDALVAPVSVLEDLKAKSAGKRARSLMRRAPVHGPGTPAVWSLYTLLGFVFIGVWGGIEACFALLDVGDFVRRLTSGLPLQPLFLSALDLVGPFVALWTVIPVWATTVTLLYFDRRIRLEGFDIEVLGRDLARNARKSRFEL